MNDDTKIAVDTAAVGAGLGSWLSWLPDVAALFSVIWLALRIWEMETVKRLTGRS